MAKIVNLNTPAPTLPGDEAVNALNERFAENMKAVEATLNEHMASYSDMVPEIGAHIVHAGGKRLRPLLTLACARLMGYQGDEHLRLAAAVEFMHTATLLHDDVVDESDIRRSRPTARRIWGNAASVLVGDYMLGQAFRMMVAAGSLTALDVLSSAAAVIAEGEVMQLENQRNTDTTEDSYLSVIGAKTAALFAAATEIGGVIANASDAELAALRSYGRNLGITFQLIDDTLDYGGVEQKYDQILDKNIGDDFREGKITLPLILAFRRGDEKERAFWRAAVAAPPPPLDDAALATGISYMHKHDALIDTVERAIHYGDMARDALAIFPKSSLQTQLVDLVDFCVKRSY